MTVNQEKTKSTVSLFLVRTPNSYMIKTWFSFAQESKL